ncbi:hypothetical protein [Denitrobaculum tricleocarpae]|uniref:Uncharacterized protein n=1 Tax=Denitrobaculum tricleocarpae TaxID=2591009 RepID=A0A545TQ09_9PROT|nr:hypothetical protein [Denitrobaculum tricleocarpae]TQV79314.1 hypothetical protein FKG95_16840 [Denitrobaculum tricleocarpae]
MGRASRSKIGYALVAVGVVTAGVVFNWGFDEPAATPEAVWSDHLVSRIHASCIKESEGQAPAIQEVVCNCQVSEMKRWLQPSDMTVHFAAVDGRKGWTEVEEFTRDLSKPEQQEFLGRINQFRESLLPTCAKVALNAGLTKEDIQGQGL